ncbi:H-NS family nucleoid-associated regulatory protein [Imbroritus primus]|uniref:H-NS family nucleoid-associated regulatory protein n=1 Tax=Imbroritus primus TaxID=3058603 RepID=UPI003D16171A
MSQSDRAAAIAWIRQKIDEYALTLDDLGPFPEQLPENPGTPVHAAALYRSADGKTWDGEGDMPEWLRRAVAAGQSPEHFRVG